MPSTDEAPATQVAPKRWRALAAGGALVALVAALPFLPVARTSAAFTDATAANVTVSAATGVPIGSMSQHLGSEAPEGWVFAHGQSLSRTEYPELFALIGTTYGGTGSTFNLPDLRGRTPVGLSPSEVEFSTLGKSGGAKAHTLTVAEMPSHGHDGTATSAGAHSHDVTVDSGGSHTHTATSSSAGNHSHDSLTVDGIRITWQASKSAGTLGSIHGDSSGSNISTGSAGAHTHSVTVNSGGAHTHSATASTDGEHAHDVDIDATGGGQAHNNLQPYTTVNFIVKAK